MDWLLEGEWFKNCNCDPGCPCDFNQHPTNANCEGVVANGAEQRARDAKYATLLDRLPWGHRQRIWEYDVRDALHAIKKETNAECNR